MKNREFYVLLILLLVLPFLGNAQEKEKKKKKDKAEKAVDKLDEQKKIEMDMLYFNGLREKSKGNFPEAVEYFRKVLSIDPLNDGALYEMGQLYVATNKRQEALLFFKEAARLEPKNEWYLNSVARMQEQLKNYKEASENYLALTKLKPENPEYFFDLATNYILLGKFEDALKVYDQIQAKIGINENVSIQKEKIYLKLGKVEKAADELRALIKHAPKEVKYKLMLAELYLANDIPDKAFGIYNDVLKDDPENGYALLAIADYYRINKDDAKSYQYLKRAFANPAIDIDNKVRILAPYFAALSDTLMKERAMELSKIMTQAHSDDAKAFAIYGDFLYQNRQLKEAKEAYKETINLDKKVFAVWQNLLFIEAELGDYDDLLKSSNEALELFPNQVPVHYLNAVAKMQVKDYEGAVSSYKNGLALIVDNKELEAQIYAGMGDAYHSLNKHKESDAAYESALKLKPDEAFVLNNFAYYLSLRNADLERAEKMSARSNELSPNNPSFLDTYAWIMYQQKKYDQAKIWIEKALASGGDSSSTVVEHYGDILFQLGKTNEALVQWHKAKELGSDNAILTKKINDKKIYE